MVCSITRVGEGINRALLTFKATHHIRRGFVRGGPPSSYSFKKPKGHLKREGTPHRFPIDLPLPMIDLNSQPVSALMVRNFHH